MEVVIRPNAGAAADLVAQVIARAMRSNPQLVMGLAIAGLIIIAATHLWRMAEVAGWGSSMLKKDWDKYELLSVYAKGILGATIFGNVMARASVKKG